MGDYLYHFSEDPTIEAFVPRIAPTQQVEGAFVWAVDTRREPTYWFPRDCPRATWWNADDTGHRTHAIQWNWLDRFLATDVYVYRLDAATFRRTEDVFGADGRGFWVTEETVEPIDVSPVGPLLDKHRGAGIEFRVVPDLKALWADVIATPGLDFSGIRLGNLDSCPDAF
ncbi:MAG: hypothetical protein Q8K63_01715 [Acidimicrobiales bacterium]|nr:hypothetical protein [Acidimicrobiales bacterium]